MNLTKKMGPLPVWAWGLILGVAGYYVYSRYRSSSTTSSTPTSPTVLDPNSVDPNTGLTYGQEEDAALNANAAALSGSGVGSGGGATPTTSDLQTSTNELADLGNLLGEFGTVASDLGYQPPGSSVPASNVSATTAAAVASPPIQAQSAPPTVQPAANTSVMLHEAQQSLAKKHVTTAKNKAKKTIGRI